MSYRKSKGTSVQIKETENINVALRRFKRKIEDSGLLDELRKRECYDKPSIHRKKAKSAAKARWNKKLRDQSLPKKLF
jgi:small subunit ribosomal protein S21